MSALARLLEQATPGPWEFRVWGRDGDEWPDSRVSVAVTKAWEAWRNQTSLLYEAQA